MNVYVCVFIPCYSCNDKFSANTSTNEERTEEERETRRELWKRYSIHYLHPYLLAFVFLPKREKEKKSTRRGTERKRERERKSDIVGSVGTILLVARKKKRRRQLRNVNHCECVVRFGIRLTFTTPTSSHTLSLSFSPTMNGKEGVGSRGSESERRERDRERKIQMNYIQLNQLLRPTRSNFRWLVAFTNLVLSNTNCSSFDLSLRCLTFSCVCLCVYVSLSNIV